MVHAETVRPLKRLLQNNILVYAVKPQYTKRRYNELNEE